MSLLTTPGLLNINVKDSIYHINLNSLAMIIYNQHSLKIYLVGVANAIEFRNAEADELYIELNKIFPVKNIKKEG